MFATETLAAGINMPARSTVIGALSRRRDRGITMLTHNELLQMAGRAGRRGFDTQGVSPCASPAGVSHLCCQDHGSWQTPPTLPVLNTYRLRSHAHLTMSCTVEPLALTHQLGSEGSELVLSEASTRLLKAQGCTSNHCHVQCSVGLALRKLYHCVWCCRVLRGAAEPLRGPHRCAGHHCAGP